MKKTVIAATLTALTLGMSNAALANTKAGDFASGLELDSKMNMDTGSAGNRKEFGAKVFASYQGAGLSHKVKAGEGNETETNLNYTYGWENVWLTGEAELVTKKLANDQHKFGLTVGSNLNGLFDTSLRYRLDKDSESKFADRSEVDRFDFFVGKQLTDNVYLGAKAISQTENTASRQGSKKDWMNYEVRATFNNVSPNMIPYFEYAREYNQNLRKDDNNVKVGLVLPF
ncbi:hypothetical protein [Vibrio sp.]|uniref:hypothetical protein n=1 Tax=Vibrio sp. TaxID=678 RepID=UPI003D14F674